MHVKRKMPMYKPSLVTVLVILQMVQWKGRELTSRWSTWDI